MVASLKTVACQNCGAPILIRAQGISITFACQSCGSIMDSTQKGYKLLKRATDKTNQLSSLWIPLGSRGELAGVEWEVIGFMRREDVTWNFYWDEYLLFNPYHGFRFLIHSYPESHFAVATLLTKRPGELGIHQIKLDEREFSLFHKGVSAVRDIAGEFYWRVRVNDRTEYAEYINPPFGISEESPVNGAKGAETTFSLQEYISVDEVGAAFKISNLPMAYGTYPIQPNRWRVAEVSIWYTAFIALWVLVIGQIWFVGKCANRAVFAGERVFQRSEASTEQLLGEVELPLRSQNIKIASRSPVDNSWVEVEYELKSADEGESGWAGQAIEYYHGYTDGESWAEGSTSTASVIGPLGGQRYKLFATVDADSFSRDMGTSVETIITADVPVWDNFLFAFVVLLAWPALVSMRARMIERQRWAESDYSPFSSDDGDSDSSSEE